MRVKIVKCSGENYWYKKHIGEEFEVYKYDSEDYRVVGEDGCIKIIDSEIIPNPDAIKPSHYKTSLGVDVLDISEAYNLKPSVMLALKYQLRAGKKDPEKYIEDLQKAIECLQREIEFERKRV